MNILFEEDGSFRAGTLMADNTTSVQVELPGGKRSKVKAANVVLRFGSPSPSELLQRAEAEGADIDVSLLWEVSVSMPLDSRSIDSGNLRCTSARPAASARSQSGRKIA